MDDFFEKIIKFVDKYKNKTLVGLVFAAFLGPIIIWLCYSVFPVVVETEITADGMLGYWGNILSGTVSVFVAIIALYQAGMIRRLEEESAAEARRQEICPKLYVSLKEKDGYFEVLIGNNAPYRAIGVYLFEYNLASKVDRDKPVKRRVAFQDESSKGYTAIDSSYYELDDNGYPKKLYFSFTDIDNNLIEQEFKLVEGDQYAFEGSWYL